MLTTLATNQARQLKLTNYLTRIVGTNTETNTPRLVLDEIKETLIRKFGNYIIKEPTKGYNLESNDSDYSAFFDIAFGTGYEVKHAFDIMIQTSSYFTRLNSISKSRAGTDSGTEGDSGTITDSGTYTETNTPTQTVTITPSGNKVVQTSGSSSGTNEGKLGAWDDTNYKGATYDSDSATATSTETTTDGKIITTTHSGKESDISGTKGNTRTISDSKTKSGSFSESESINLDWKIDDIIKYIESSGEFDLYYWVCREICYDTCITERGFYM